jgi:hypothetical protein
LVQLELRVNARLEHVSGEHRLLACPFRQLAEKLVVQFKFRFAKNVVGKLPTTAGKLPALARTPFATR